MNAIETPGPTVQFHEITLPPELLIRIIHFSEVSCPNIFLVSHSWYQILNHDQAIWKIFCKRLGIVSRAPELSWKKTFWKRSQLLRICLQEASTHLGVQYNLLSIKQKLHNLIGKYYQSLERTDTPFPNSHQYSRYVTLRELYMEPDPFNAEGTSEEVLNALNHLHRCYDLLDLHDKNSFLKIVFEIHTHFIPLARSFCFGEIDDRSITEKVQSELGRVVNLAERVKDEIISSTVSYNSFIDFLGPHYHKAVEIPEKDITFPYADNQSIPEIKTKGALLRSKLSSHHHIFVIRFQLNPCENVDFRYTELIFYSQNAQQVWCYRRGYHIFNEQLQELRPFQHAKELLAIRQLVERGSINYDGRIFQTRV